MRRTGVNACALQLRRTLKRSSRPRTFHARTDRTLKTRIREPLRVVPELVVHGRDPLRL